MRDFNLTMRTDFTEVDFPAGTIVTLFALMQLTAKVDWEQAIGGQRTAPASSAG